MRGRTRRREPSITFPRPEAQAAGEAPPKKVAWLAPWQLFKTGLHVWLETVGSGLVDRREVMAALDRSHTLANFAGGSIQTGDRIDGYVQSAGPSMSIDFVADVGDSWEATYAIATLLADTTLRARFGSSAAQSLPEDFPRGDVLVLGGDLVYPWPKRDSYRRRLVAPFSAAFPQSAANAPRPSLVAIPGNHDWYDGLTGFTRTLCQGESIGGWKLGQTRSYFALKLAAGWWIWGIDIALDTRVDAPQMAYFKAILNSANDINWKEEEKFQPDDRIILCTAKPAWLEMSRYSDEAYRNLMKFVDDIIHGADTGTEKPEAKHHETSDQTVRPQAHDVPVILTGDLHHYCHYECARADDDPSDPPRRKSPTHLIVAGGGGAFLMGTHFLSQDIPPLSKPDAFPELPKERPSDSTDPFTLTATQYPNMSESRRLALGAALLAFRPQNWQFCILLGFVYWLLTPDTRGAAYKIPWTWSPMKLIQSIWDQPCQVSLVWALIALATCVAFAVGANSRASRVPTALWGAFHALVHVVVALSVSIGMTAIASRFVRYPVFVVVGGLIAGTVVGVYLALSDRYLDLHHNDAFAVQSIIDYRNFLRMIIDEAGNLTIYPIGLRRVPRRWRRRVDGKPTDPLYEPADAALSPHLIEGPIVIPSRPKPLSTTRSGAADETF